VKHVGQAPLEKPADDASSPFASGIPLLKPGEPIPNATFVDQDGKKRDLVSYRGSAVVITFMYTKCPLPTFCPLMDRNFATIQQRLKADRALDVKLVSISFDPLTDTPPVLKKHAKELGADPKVWSFFTGTRDDIDRFSARLGVIVARAPENERDITHNLRTAIVDRQGNLVKTYTGNEWTPDQVLTDIKTLVGVN
jgi:protein SCO1/2